MRTVRTIFLISVFAASVYWGCKKDDNPIIDSSNKIIDTAMVSVQGGTFQIGSPDSSGAADKHPRHQVTLHSFLIGKYEVTQKRWREVVVWKQGAATLPLNPNPSYLPGNLLPVKRVS